MPTEPRNLHFGRVESDKACEQWHQAPERPRRVVMAGVLFIIAGILLLEVLIGFVIVSLGIGVLCGHRLSRKILNILCFIVYTPLVLMSLLIVHTWTLEALGFNVRGDDRMGEGFGVLFLILGWIIITPMIAGHVLLYTKAAKRYFGQMGIAPKRQSA